MDTALARTARFPVRCALRVVCAPTSWSAHGRRGGVPRRSSVARLGVRSHQKNDALAVSGPTPTRVIRFISELYSRPRVHYRLGPVVARILFAALFLGIYLPVMRVESATLAQLFGEGFQAYAEAVPLFLPRLTPFRTSEAHVTFDTALYLRYREYRAALGLLIAWGLLVFKAYYLK